MAEIVKLADYKVQTLLRDGFAIWHQKLEGRFDDRTRLKDLSANTLCRLAEPGDESADALYGMIIGFLGHGKVLFNDLDTKVQSHVIDMHLFMSDHIRFEMMERLGWLEQFMGNHFPLFEMVRDWEQVKPRCLQNPPVLSPDHPDYSHYQGLIDRDQQVFIRRMLPTALDIFKKANDL